VAQRFRIFFCVCLSFAESEVWLSAFQCFCVSKFFRGGVARAFALIFVFLSFSKSAHYGKTQKHKKLKTLSHPPLMIVFNFFVFLSFAERGSALSFVCFVFLSFAGSEGWLFCVFEFCRD